MNITIRQATNADSEGIITAQRESWRATYVSPENGVTKEWVYERSANFNAERANEILQSHAGNADFLDLVAVTDDGEIAGMLRGEKKADHSELRAIYAHPKYIGQGVGGKLIESFLDWIDTSKPSTIECVSYNKRAIGFYEHYGYKVTDKELPKYADVLPSVEMVRAAESKEHHETT